MYLCIIWNNSGSEYNDRDVEDIEDRSETFIDLSMEWSTIDFSQDRMHRIDQATQNNGDEEKVHQRNLCIPSDNAKSVYQVKAYAV